jgi:DNA-directed RNA polymerase subunit RPC12/RpoP
MDLEERTIEHLPDRCESCGAELTDAEKQTYLEANRTGPVLCATCAAEVVPLAEDEAEDAEV